MHGQLALESLQSGSAEASLSLEPDQAGGQPGLPHLSSPPYSLCICFFLFSCSASVFSLFGSVFLSFLLSLPTFLFCSSFLPPSLVFPLSLLFLPFPSLPLSLFSLPLSPPLSLGRVVEVGCICVCAHYGDLTFSIPGKGAG